MTAFHNAKTTFGAAGSPLTDRERTVLVALSKGLTKKQIVREMSISIYTIEERVKSIYRKLGVNSRAEAAVCAVHLGLI